MVHSPNGTALGLNGTFPQNGTHTQFPFFDFFKKTIQTRLKLHSVLTRENPRLLSTYKTDRSNRKQDKTAGLQPGRTMVGQDWDTTAGLWPDKTGTRLPAYGRTRLPTYGQTRLPGKTICRTICRTMA
jgi:hypothetical protein